MGRKTYFQNEYDYKKFVIVAILIADDEDAVYGNIYGYYGNHSCDNTIYTKVRKDIDKCKDDIDIFWDRYGICPDFQVKYQKAKKAGRVSINTKCNIDRTIKSTVKGKNER